MGQEGPTELKMAQIGPVVLELQCLKEFGCPMGIPTRAERVNNLAIAHLQAKMVS